MFLNLLEKYIQYGVLLNIGDKNNMKKYIAGIWFAVCLMAAPHLEGMEESVRKDLVDAQRVETFLQDFNPDYQLLEIKRKTEWDGKSNSEGFNDPTFHTSKLLHEGEELAVVVKAVSNRSEDELAGSNRLKSYLEEIQVDFCTKTKYPFDVYGFKEDDFELLFISIYLSKSIKLNDHQQVLLELTLKGPDKSIYNCYNNYYNDNIPENIEKSYNCGKLAGHAFVHISFGIDSESMLIFNVR